MLNPTIQLELLPEELSLLRKWACYPSFESQLKAPAASDGVTTITLSPVDVCWIASDLTHAIVKNKCQSSIMIEFSERMDFVDQTHDGRLESWYL